MKDSKELDKLRRWKLYKDTRASAKAFIEAKLGHKVRIGSCISMSEPFTERFDCKFMYYLNTTYYVSFYINSQLHELKTFSTFKEAYISLHYQKKYDYYKASFTSEQVKQLFIDYNIPIQHFNYFKASLKKLDLLYKGITVNGLNRVLWSINHEDEQERYGYRLIPHRDGSIHIRLERGKYELIRQRTI